MTNFERIKSFNFERMVSFIDKSLSGYCDNCPAYNICDTDQFNQMHCKPYLRAWLESEEEATDDSIR